MKRRTHRRLQSGRRPDHTSYDPDLLQHVNDAIILFDPELRVTLWNKAAERIYGYTTAEAMGRTSVDLMRPDYDGATRDEVLKRLWGEGRLEIESIHETKDGRKLHIETRSVVLRDEDGRVHGVVTVNRDVTDRKMAEEKLRESERRLRQAMVAGRIFSFEWDPKTDVVHRSADCAAILGLDPSGCERDTGGAYVGQIHEEDRETFTRTLRGLTPERPWYKIEYRYTTPDGRTIWLESNARADFDEKGELVRVHGISAEVTDRVEKEATEKYAAAARSVIDTLNAMGDGVIVLRMDGVVTAVNLAVELLTGIDGRDVIGRNLKTVLPRFLSDDDLSIALDALDTVSRRKTPELGSVVFRTTGPRPVSINPSFNFIETSPGKSVMAVLTLRDVTELHETFELLNQIFDNTHMLIAYLDLDFNFVRVNRAYADACRREPDFFLGRGHFELYPHAENELIFRRVRHTGDSFFAYEKPFEFPDQPDRGVTYWDWSLRPINDEKGKMEGLLFCLVDRTEKVLAQNQFLSTEKKYRELVENANSVILRLTADHRITFFNEYAQNFFGYTAEEVLGKSVIGTIVPEVDSEGRDLTKTVKAVMAAPELYGSNENENICKNGRRVWVHWSNRAVRDERGLVKEILCVGTDITKRRQLEREADAYREQLHKLADRITATAEQERRRVSAQIHDTVIQTLSLANIRLGGIRGALEAAGVPDQCEKVNEARGLIDTGISECRGLMADLTPPLLYELGLGLALKEFAEKQQKLHGIPIAVDVEEVTEFSDEARRGFLFQAARELVMNALRHAGPCEIRVKVRRDGRDIRLDVRDTGEGFDLSKADLFRVGEKGGFGLFNLRERSQGLGGSVAIKSAPGKGTQATVRIPLVEG
jgi:PAS domain S-box-containing protein